MQLHHQSTSWQDGQKLEESLWQLNEPPGTCRWYCPASRLQYTPFHHGLLPTTSSLPPPALTYQSQGMSRNFCRLPLATNVIKTVCRGRRPACLPEIVAVATDTLTAQSYHEGHYADGHLWSVAEGPDYCHMSCSDSRQLANNGLGSGKAHHTSSCRLLNSQQVVRQQGWFEGGPWMVWARYQPGPGGEISAHAEILSYPPFLCTTCPPSFLGHYLNSCHRCEETHGKSISLQVGKICSFVSQSTILTGN